eukprot:3415936-Prymnesium_polylepis.2
MWPKRLTCTSEKPITRRGHTKRCLASPGRQRGARRVLKARLAPRPRECSSCSRRAMSARINTAGDWHAAT